MRYRSCDQDPPVGPETQKTEHSMCYILFFNKIHYRHELDAYNYNFCRVREPYLARLGSSGLCFCTGWHSTLCGCLTRARMPVKTMLSGHSIPFFDRLHCNYEQNRYINYFRNVQEAYLVWLGLSDSFSAPASRARTWGGGAPIT